MTVSSQAGEGLSINGKLASGNVIQIQRTRLGYKFLLLVLIEGLLI